VINQIKSGAVFLANLEPVLGTEQAGIRPVIVVSIDKFHTFSRRAIICPITKNMSPYVTKLFLPLSTKTKGAVLLDQVRAIDWQKRFIRHIEDVPFEFLKETRILLSSILFDINEIPTP
jgi:mRNA interferase MazF